MEVKASGTIHSKKDTTLTSSRLWYFIAIIVFVILTTIAFFQGPRPDPFDSKSFYGWGWLKNPIERNAFKRLPVVTSDISDLCMQPGTNKIWIAGAGGLIAYSDDDGDSWEQYKFGSEANLEKTRREQSAHRYFPSLISEVYAEEGLRPKALPDERRRPQMKLRTAQMTRQQNPQSNLSDVGEQQKTPLKPSTTRAPIPKLPKLTKDLNVISLKSKINSKQTVADETRKAVKDKSLQSSNVTKDNKQTVKPPLLKIDLSLIDYSAIFFANAELGWAVGDKGVVIHTIDGGMIWNEQNSGTRESLEGVQFLDYGNTGWAVGRRGVIIHTTDGGGSWTKQNTSIENDLTSIQFLEGGNTGWAVGSRGVIVHTKNGGNSWSVQNSRTKEFLTKVQFLEDGKIGWAVGTSRIIIHTANGGNSWRVQKPATEEWFDEVKFLEDGKTGWATASEGVILYTRDGGDSWRKQKSGAIELFAELQFLEDAKAGWAISDVGTILHTRDGGESWSEQESGTNGWLNGFQILEDGQAGWVVGDGGIILHTSDGGNSWSEQESGTEENLYKIQILEDGKAGWVVGDKGIILHTSNGGNSWSKLKTGIKNWFLEVHFIKDGNTGWAVGRRGTISHTTNGGNNWREQESGTKELLTGVQFLEDAKIGWVLGVSGTIIHTIDGGQNWKSPVLPYRKYPAPWYYFSLIVVVALLIPATRKPKPPKAGKPSIANMLIPDKPLEEGDPDPIDFKGIAYGLSRYLRNENTKPPLTVAITGEWGTGKSSLMNLLRANLSRYGFMPVWFNAWHHQKEEHLLASLLENIRNQAIPAVWRWSGLLFRIKLLKIKGWRKWLPVFSMFLIFIYSMGYFASDPSRLKDVQTHMESLKVSTKGRVVTVLDKVIAKIRSSEGNKDSSKSKEKSSQSGQGRKSEEKFSVVFFLISMLSSLLLLYTSRKGLIAFGVNPTGLISSITGRVRVKDFKAQTGFWYRFAKEFRDVTRALHPRTMLILIDDLDRCRPDNVLEVLEAINFLATSGECFIVMGMDRDRVEKCVGIGFKDVAEELAEDIEEHKDRVDSNSIVPDKDGENNKKREKNEGKRRRVEFAVQYLEKLVNIEVPVPKLTPDQSRELMTLSNKDDLSETHRNITLMKTLTITGKVFAVLAVVSLVGFLFWSGYTTQNTHNVTPGVIVGRNTTETTDNAQNDEDKAEETSREKKIDPLEIPKVKASKRSEIINPKTESPPYYLFCSPAIMFLIPLGIWAFMRRPNVTTTDSDEFNSALDIWHDVIFAKRPTPRSLKRFINRVRYFAMRQVTYEEDLSLWEKIQYWLRDHRSKKERNISKQEEEKSEASSRKNIPEEFLVALSAVHHLNPDFIEKDNRLSKAIVTGKFDFTVSDEISKETVDVLKKTCADHKEKFKYGEKEDWEEYRQQFVKMSKGIRVMS